MEPQDLKAPFEKWLHLLKFGERYIDREELPGVLKNEEGLDMALKRMKYANSNEKLRAAAEAREKARRDHLSFIDDARVKALKMIEEGLEKGREEGRTEGRAEGRAEGRVEGIALGEERKTLQMAQAMKARGMDSMAIQEISGLTLEEIEKL